MNKKKKTFTKVFQDTSEGLRITLEIEDGYKSGTGNSFNLNYALMELSNQLAEQARKKGG